MDFKRYTINRRMITDLKKRSTIGIIFYLATAVVVLAAGEYYKRHMQFSIHFLASVSGICLFRLTHVLLAAKLEKINVKISDDIFFASVITTALIWGFGFAMFLMQAVEYEAKLLMSICTVGLCAGGAIAFLPERRLTIAFSLSMMTPGFVCLQIEGTNPSLATVFLFYIVYLALISLRGNKEYWDALENEYMLERKSEDLEKLSNTDVLTDMYNRRYFNEIYESEWKRATRHNHCLTIMICDIDHFKGVNDIYGHLAGDEYLKIISDILKNVFKRETDVVARYGGEEFVVLLSDVDACTACAMAELVRTTVKQTQMTYKGEIIKTTISIGVMNCCPANIENKESIIAKADKALYLAKQEGRDKVCEFLPICE